MSGVSKHLIDHYLHELLSRINFGVFNEIEGLRGFLREFKVPLAATIIGYRFFGKVHLYFEFQSINSNKKLKPVTFFLSTQ